MQASEKNPTAWYVDSPKIDAVRTKEFTGAVSEGGSVNFRNIFFNPHGHGTHTECVGHITKVVYSVNDALTQFFYLAEVITVEPAIQKNGDQIILWEQLEKKRKFLNAEAINYIDSSAAAMLINVIDEIHNRDLQFIIAGAIGPTRDIIFNSGIIDALQKDFLFVQTKEAVACFDNPEAVTLLRNIVAHQKNQK